MTAVVRSDSGRPIVSGYGGEVEVVVQTLEPGVVAPLLDRLRPQTVYNLAGYGVDPGERDEATAEWINHAFVEELCAHLGGAAPDPSWAGLRLVHVGSALEYGDARGDLREDSTPHPTTIYGRTKLEGTRAVERAAALGLRAATARIFAVYGPGEHHGRLVPSLLAAIRASGPIPLTEGRQKRDFTYVEDVAEGLLRLAAASTLEHRTVNLATGVLTEVREMACTLAEIVGIPSNRLAFGALPARAEEMSHEPVNVERVARAVGWTPSTSVRDGLTRTVELMRKIVAPAAPK